MFAAAYLLWLYQRTAFGEPSAEFSGHGQPAHAVSAAVNEEHDDTDIRDVTPIEWISWTPLLVLIVVLGVYPDLLFRVFDPAVIQLVDHLGEYLG